MPDFSTLLQMLAQQQAQQPPEQMSQQGQFNPADIQAQLQGGPQPFSFAPVPGGVGRNILNALANAGKAATYVAEDPRERQADDARAQQLWETKQKMQMAAGEFGQREKDRADTAAARKQQFTMHEQDLAAQRDIAQQGKDTEAAKLAEDKRWHDIQAAKQPKDKPDSAEQQFIDWYLGSHPGKNVGDAVTAYAKAHDKPGAESGTWQLDEDSKGTPVLFNSKTGQTKAAPDIHKAGTYAKGQGAAEDALNYATTYEKAPPTGPGDYALMMKFVEMTKPSSGFRFTMAEKQMIEQSRSWMQSAEGQAYHAKNGTWFTPEQRSQMIGTMRAVSQAKGPQNAQSQGQGTTQSNGRRVIDLTQ